MPDDRRRLRDILDCADELQQYLDGITLRAFVGDRLRQRAVERLLTIIGEAAKHVGPETRAAIDQPWSDMAKFRDKGIHAYNTLTPRTVYLIATKSVPALQKAIRDHVRTLPDDVA